MWNKIKSIALAVAIVAVTILAIILRSRPDGSGVAGDIDRAGRIGDSVDELAAGSDRTREGLEELQQNNNDALGRADNIRQNNRKAATGVRSAIEILKAAKERTDNS
ncbi:hypothetical protein KAR91_69665 [Candidatus Pacearchaeota archaeon]|nr:hypothetical protein [Candidatus Pacearchaeota archaeon]